MSTVITYALQQQAALMLRLAVYWCAATLCVFLCCCCCRRIYMTIVAGSAVGILGVEGWGGFVVYLLSQLLVSMHLFRSYYCEQSRYHHYLQLVSYSGLQSLQKEAAAYRAPKRCI
jgi:hypothetical protein